jgi:hypothetical protein
MLPKLEKLIMLDRLLRSGRRYTAEELATKLGVKKRSYIIIWMSCVLIKLSKDVTIPAGLQNRA